MRSLNRRLLVAIVVMALATPLALYLQYDVPPPTDVKVLGSIPEKLGPWLAVAERGPTDEEKEILETDAILTRTYSCGEPPECDLSVIFARDNRRVAHPPELCYKGSGWTVEKRDVVEFPVAGEPFRANRLLLLRGGLRLLVLYWYKAGPTCTENYIKMQFSIIKTQLVRRGSSSALCRVSATSPGPDDDDRVVERLRQFAAVAIPEVNRVVD